MEENRYAYKWKYKELKPKWERLKIQMKNYSSTAKRNFTYVHWYYTKGRRNISYTARHFGVSRKTITKWIKRFDESNLSTLEERSRRPKNLRQWEVSTIEKVRIISLRKKYIRLGKLKLKKLYESEYGEEISSWKIQRVIKVHKLYYSRKKLDQIKKKRYKNHSKKRITELSKKEYPYFLIQIDTVVKYYKGLKRYIITAVDHGTRIAFARMYTTHTSSFAADFIKRLKLLLSEKIINVQTDNGSEFHKDFIISEKIINVQTDNGSEFHKDFIKACKELDIKQYWSRPRTPKDNAMVERFNRTLKEEFMQLGNSTPDTELFNKWLTEWLIFYNFKRPHQSLDYLTPFEHYSRTSKVLPMYSSRTKT